MQIRMLSSALFGLCAWLSPVVAQPASDEPEWTPTPAQIAELEAHLPKSPPRGVAAATRYYYGRTSGGHRFIVGEILSFGDGKPAGIYMERHLPIVMDGGCSVINLTYDVAARTFVGYACNGMA